jgi:hypothetical protein
MSENPVKEKPLEKKAIILVHGIGNQKPLDFLREFTNALCSWINWCAGSRNNPNLVARLEAIREPTGQRGGEADIFVGNAVRIRVYEVYWADLGQAPTAGLFKSLRFSGWIIQALFRPAALSLNARPGCGLLRAAFQSVLLVIPSFVFFLLDLLTIAGRFIKRLSGIAVSVQRALLAYAGDIRLYTSGEKQVFGREVKDEIVDRFRHTLSRAHEPDEGNDAIVIVAHSLGSVVAYDGLTQDDYVNPLDGTSLPPWPPMRAYPPVDKVVAFFTLGSPLDKFNYFWPDRISMTPVTSASKKKRIWWGNFQDFLDPVGANLNAYTPQNWQAPYPCRGPYSLDNLLDGPHEYRLCNAYSPGRAHLIYWWSRAFMSTLMAHLNLSQVLPPPWLPRTVWGKLALQLQQALVKTSNFLTRTLAVPQPTEPRKGPMVYRTGFWTVVVLFSLFLARWLWDRWLSAMYFSKIHTALSQGVSYVKQAAELVLAWSGVEQHRWITFIFDGSYILVSLSVIIGLLLGAFLYTRLWTWEDMAAGFAGLILLVATILGAWLGVSWVVPYVAGSPWRSGSIGVLVIAIISWIAVRLFLNRPLQLVESLRIILNAVVFGLIVFVGMLMASWAWLILLKLFTISLKIATILVLTLAVFLLLVIRMARLRQELRRSSIERMGDAFYG